MGVDIICTYDRGCVSHIPVALALAWMIAPALLGARLARRQSWGSIARSPWILALLVCLQDPDLVSNAMTWVGYMLVSTGAVAIAVGYRQVVETHDLGRFDWARSRPTVNRFPAAG